MYSYQMQSGRGGVFRISFEKSEIPSSNVKRKLPSVEQTKRDWKVVSDDLHLQPGFQQISVKSDRSNKLSDKNPDPHRHPRRKKAWEDKNKGHKIWWKKTEKLRPKENYETPIGYTIPRPTPNCHFRLSDHLHKELDPVNSPNFNKLEPLPNIPANDEPCEVCEQSIMQGENDDRLEAEEAEYHNVPVNTVLPSVTISRRSSATDAVGS